MMLNPFWLAPTGPAPVVIVIDTFEDNLMIAAGLATSPLPNEPGSQGYPFTLRPLWPAELDGKTIVDAGFAFTAGTGYGDTRTLEVKRLLRAWVEGQATPTIYATGSPWTALDAAGDGTDRVAVSSASGNYPGGFYTGVTGVIGAGLISDLNGMAAGTLPKNGWLVTSDPTAGNGPSLALPGNATPAFRPTLTVAYLP